MEKNKFITREMKTKEAIINIIKKHGLMVLDFYNERESKEKEYKKIIKFILSNKNTTGMGKDLKEKYMQIAEDYEKGNNFSFKIKVFSEKLFLGILNQATKQNNDVREKFNKTFVSRGDNADIDFVNFAREEATAFIQVDQKGFEYSQLSPNNYLKKEINLIKNDLTELFSNNAETELNQ